jgi:hypothetical protein
MKAKAARDLPKLVKYKEKIEPILCGIPITRWILLCPFLDSKEVVADVRKRGLAIKEEGLTFLAPDFEALCHSQDDFAGELEQLKLLPLGPPLSIDMPTPCDISAVGATSIATRIDEKLARAYGPVVTDAQITQRRDAYIKVNRPWFAGGCFV